MCLPEHVKARLETCSHGHPAFRKIIYETTGTLPSTKALRGVPGLPARIRGGHDTRTLVVQRPRSPTNLEGCKLAFVDDFKPTQDLSGAVLCQISGNNLTAARKFKGENVFKFHGMLMICANGLWRSDEEWKGADRRRLTGLPFQVEFVDQPRGPNQSKKDSSVKESIKSYFPEFWFLVRVLWLSAKPFPRSDHIEPRHSRTIGMVQDLLNFGCSPTDVPDSEPGIFVRECLVQYHPSEQKPSTCGEILAVRLQVEQS